MRCITGRKRVLHRRHKFEVMEKTKQWIVKYRYFLLFFVILMTLLRYVYLFVNVRDGHHSDEAWTYGFANSFYQPSIYLDPHGTWEGEDDTEIYYQEWVPGRVLHDYLTVQQEERFRYDSVMFNKAGDMSPALYALLLHTVCSFFPDVFSWWFAFGLNLALYIVAQVLLFQVSLFLLTDMDQRHGAGQGEISWWMVAVAVLICLYYGLSTASVSTWFCMRGYGLATMLGLAFLYAIIYYFRLEENNVRWRNVLIINLLTAMGAFSHFYFLVYAFFCTGFIMLFLLLRKGYKRAFTLGGSQLLTVIAFLIIVPGPVQTLLKYGSRNSGTSSYPFHWKVRTAMDYICRYTFGINWNVTSLTALHFGIGLFWTIIALGAVVFLFRKELRRNEVFRKLFALRIRSVRQIPEHVLEMSLIWGTALGYILVVSHCSEMVGMGEYSVRYLVLILPGIVIAVFVAGIHVLFFVKPFVGKKKIWRTLCTAMGLLIIFFGFRNMSIQSPYLFVGTKVGDWREILNGQQVILISGKGWRLEWYSVLLQDCDQFFSCPHTGETNVDGWKDLSVILTETDPEKEMYLILEEGAFPVEADRGYSIGWERTKDCLEKEAYFEALQKNIGKDIILDPVDKMSCFVGDLGLYKVRFQ